VKETRLMMKSLCLVILLGLSMPGCSIFDKNARQERAYHKYVKKSKAARERQRSRMIHQRAEMPSLRSQQPSPVQENVQTSEGQ
jgi:hypothetical protein